MTTDKDTSTSGEPLTLAACLALRTLGFPQDNYPAWVYSRAHTEDWSLWCADSEIQVMQATGGKWRDAEWVACPPALAALAFVREKGYRILWDRDGAWYWTPIGGDVWHDEVPAADPSDLITQVAAYHAAHAAGQEG